MGGGHPDRSLVERNALSLGWHVGFYYFVLGVAAKN